MKCLKYGKCMFWGKPNILCILRTTLALQFRSLLHVIRLNATSTHFLYSLEALNTSDTMLDDDINAHQIKQMTSQQFVKRKQQHMTPQLSTNLHVGHCCLQPLCPVLLFGQ